MAAVESSRNRTAPWAVLLPLTVILLSSVASSSTSSPALQEGDDDPDRMLTYEQNTLFMYGEDSGDDYTQWETWNHAEPNDGQSTDNFFESNDGITSSGGPREFTFDGSDANTNDTAIDADQPITGTMNLNINCNGCSKEVTITMRLGPKSGGRDISTVTLAGPDEVDGDIYTFQFEGHSIDNVKAGEVFGLRISFTKSSSFFEGYTLYLGRGNFELEVPVLPPYEEEVPGLDIESGKEYVSPYAKGDAGFVEIKATSSGYGGPIFYLILSAGIAALIMFLLPPQIGIWKVLSVVMVTSGMLATLTIIPILSGPIALASAIDENDPNVWTIDELAALQEREGTFLGELVEDTEFQLWIEYDVVYRAKDVEGHGDWHYGLGFEPYGEKLSDPAESTPRGREYAQLYFSLLNIDPTLGSAVIINVKMINVTGSDGESRIVPQWAAPADEENQFWVKSADFGGRWVIPEKMADGTTVIEVVGVSYDWQFYPMILVLLGIAMGGVGIWQLNKGRGAAHSDHGYDDDDDDFDDDFDLDEDEEDDFDDDFDLDDD